MEAIEKNNQRRIQYLEPLGIYVNFPEPAIYKGNKFWMLGSRLWYERPSMETFHEFLIFVLYQMLGEGWRDEQLGFQNPEKHFIYRCAEEFDKFRWENSNSEKVNGLWAVSPNGYVRSLLSLAFDVASLFHTEHVPTDIFNRLKTRDQYQGARYEIAIAAIFARLGYKITFLDEQNVKETHPEFIAEDLDTNERIAIEVKSKEKRGVLHVSGAESEGQILRGDVGRLYRHALRQNPGNMPFVVFIDVNVPQDPNIPWEQKPWIKDIDDIEKKALPHGPANPNPCTALIYTNFSYHYQTENEALPAENLITWASYPVFPIKRLDFIQRLMKALKNYGNVPNLT
jgi:hypothetical protein